MGRALLVSMLLLLFCFCFLVLCCIGFCGLDYLPIYFSVIFLPVLISRYNVFNMYVTLI